MPDFTLADVAKRGSLCSQARRARAQLRADVASVRAGDSAVMEDPMGVGIRSRKRSLKGGGGQRAVAQRAELRAKQRWLRTQHARRNDGNISVNQKKETI